MWVRPIFQRRRQQGAFHQLLKELRLSDPESHFRYLRMSKEKFDLLLSEVSPFLTSRCYDSNVRASISAAEKLALTLRYLATGNSQASLSFSFRVGRSTVSNIVLQTCEVLWQVLMPQYVTAPTTEAGWESISQQFQQMWNFPHCIGAIDGKHITLQAPKNAGSEYFNYKGTHSISLLAVCDAHYRFTLVDIGDAGRNSDGGVLSNSLFGQALEANSLSIPKPSPLPGTTTDFPHVLVGDEAFPLKEYMLRPYPGRHLSDDRRVFNYRLSRARRVIENAFGILAARWRIFRRPIIAEPSRAVAYTKAAIALHNYLRTTEAHVYCPPGFTDGEDGSGNPIAGTWRRDGSGSSGLAPVSNSRMGSNRHSYTAAENRDRMKAYFSSTQGELSWQYEHVNRTC